MYNHTIEVHVFCALAARHSKMFNPQSCITPAVTLVRETTAWVHMAVGLLTCVLLHTPLLTLLP